MLEADANHVLLAYQLRPTLVQIQADGQDEPDQVRIVRTGAARPVFGLLNGRGRIQSVRFDPATNSLIKTNGDHVARRDAVRRAESRRSFSVRMGCRRRRSRRHARRPLSIASRRHGPQNQAARSEPARSKKTKTIHIDPKVESDGEYVAKLDAAHALAGISAEEGQSISYRQNVIGQATLKFDMQLLDKVQCTADELTQLQSANAERTIAAAAVPLNATMSDEESQLAVQRQELGDATLESLLVDLDAVDSQPPPAGDGNRLFLKFKALAIVRPASWRGLARY